MAPSPADMRAGAGWASVRKRGGKRAEQKMENSKKVTSAFNTTSFQSYPFFLLLYPFFLFAPFHFPLRSFPFSFSLHSAWEYILLRRQRKGMLRRDRWLCLRDEKITGLKSSLPSSLRIIKKGWGLKKWLHSHLSCIWDTKERTICVLALFFCPPALERP